MAKMPLLVSSRTSNRAFDLEAWLNGVLSVVELNVVGHFDLIGNVSHLVRSGTACAVDIGSLLQIDKCSDLRFVPFEPPLTIASYRVRKKYRLRSRAREEFQNRLNGM